jgi:hypothetical protein
MKLNNRTITLSAALFGCDTCSVTLLVKHRLRISENKVLRKIFNSKAEEATGNWRKLHYQKLHDLYSYPNVIWEIKVKRRWARRVACGEENKSVQSVVDESFSE